MATNGSGSFRRSQDVRQSPEDTLEEENLDEIPLSNMDRPRTDSTVQLRRSSRASSVSRRSEVEPSSQTTRSHAIR